MKKNTFKCIVGKNGKLVVRFFDNEGKIKQKTLNLADTKANRTKVHKTIPAFEKALREEAEKSSKAPVYFGYYADKYLDELKATRHSKLIAHTARVKKMLTYFGSQTSMDNITELSIDEFFQSLTCKRKTKLDWLVVIRGIFDKARRGRALEKNIFEHFKLPHEASSDNESAIEPFTVDEVRKLLFHSKGMILHYYLGIAFHLGTRPEETIALQIKDINLSDGIVRIERAITKGECKPPKTKGSIRSVPLPDQAKAFFVELIHEANRKGSIHLFSDDTGAALNDIEDLRGRKSGNGPWYKLLKKANVPLRKLMQTRHTFAVQAISSNAFTMQEVALILGHSSLNMIISHYGKYLGSSHLNISRSVDIFNRKGDLMGDSGKGTEDEKVA